MNENLTVKEKALVIAKEIIIASMQNNTNFYMDPDYATQISESLEIIYNKALNLIK